MSDPNTAAVKKKDPAASWKHALRLVLTLVIITAAAALVLTVVNALTAGVIAQRQADQHRADLVSVMPEADVFSQLYSEDETITGITGAYAGTQFVGYCVEVSPSGFGGAISMVVGVTPGGSVTGVTILEHAEIRGLGSKLEDAQFLDQFIGKSGTVTVNSGQNAINAITGATITSQAVADGVNTALTAVLNHMAEGGQPPDEGDI